MSDTQKENTSDVRHPGKKGGWAGKIIKFIVPLAVSIGLCVALFRDIDSHEMMPPGREFRCGLSASGPRCGFFFTVYAARMRSTSFSPAWEKCGARDIYPIARMLLFLKFSGR